MKHPPVPAGYNATEITDRSRMAAPWRPASVRNTHSADLLNPDGMLRIEHRGAIYTLRTTRNGGLILTK